MSNPTDVDVRDESNENWQREYLTGGFDSVVREITKRHADGWIVNSLEPTGSVNNLYTAYVYRRKPEPVSALDWLCSELEEWLSIDESQRSEPNLRLPTMILQARERHEALQEQNAVMREALKERDIYYSAMSAALAVLESSAHISERDQKEVERILAQAMLKGHGES